MKALVVLIALSVGQSVRRSRRDIVGLPSSIRALALLLALGASAHAAPPKLYAAMFQKGHRWTYDVTTTVRMSDGTGSKETSVLTCEVAAVNNHAKAVASTITCDRVLDSDYAFVPDGSWLATSSGLSRGDYDELDGSAPVIAAAPRVSFRRTKDGYGGFFITKVLTRKDMWCTQEDTTHGGAGDGAITTLCFEPGKGLAWAELDYRGGDPRDVVYKAR